MAHTREELENLLRPPLGEENALDKWRRDIYKEELRLLDEREQQRPTATGAEMQRWSEYFEGRIANERAALAEQINNARDVMVEAAGAAIAEFKREIEVENKCAIDAVSADMKQSIAGLQQVLDKQKTIIEKLLPEMALLKRQVKALEDVHNKSIQNSLTHLHDRMTAMESERRVGNENAIAKLQTRVEHAETKLKGAAQLDRLPAWIREDHDSAP
jgi:hypothetical protein